MKPEDLQIESLRHPSAGGQSVGVTCPGCRVKHLPSGLVAESWNDRSQYRNKAVAMAMIEYGLAEIGRKV